MYLHVFHPSKESRCCQNALSNLKVCKILPFRHKCSIWGFLKGLCQDFSLSNLERLTCHRVWEKTFLRVKCLKQRIEINKVYWRSPIHKWSEKGWIVIWKVAEAVEYRRYKSKSWPWEALKWSPRAAKWFDKDLQRRYNINESKFMNVRKNNTSYILVVMEPK